MRAGFVTDRWKRSVDHYVSAAKALYGSMVHDGFDPSYPIPIDPDGELLDGSHRLACALALGIEEVPVMRCESKAWAPPWGEAWFASSEMNLNDLKRLRDDFYTLRR